MADDLGGFVRCHFFRRLLFVFGRPQTLKIELSPRREHDFYKIDVFKNCWENCGFGMHFGKPNRCKNDKNMYSRTHVFLALNFFDFCSILVAFWEVGTFQHGPFKVPAIPFRPLSSGCWGALQPRKATRGDFSSLLVQFGVDYGML